MIANDEQLQIVREQVNRLESALESLENTVRPKSESQYQVFAEGYVDQIEILRTDIDRYLKVPSTAKAALEVEVPANERVPH